MKIEIAICAPSGEPHLQMFRRFVDSYTSFPPFCDHSTIILTDFNPLNEIRELAKTLHDSTIFECDGRGYDLSRYQDWAAKSTADMVVWCGGSTYCRKQGWLARFASAFSHHGTDGIYGACGNLGAPPGVRPHIRTTGWAISPGLLNRYPVKVNHPSMRYPAEHGNECITEWVRSQGLPALVVDWDGVWEHPHWNKSPNGYHKGDQSALLLGDRVTTKPYFNGF